MKNVQKDKIRNKCTNLRNRSCLCDSLELLSASLVLAVSHDSNVFQTRNSEKLGMFFVIYTAIVEIKKKK